MTINKFMKEMSIDNGNDLFHNLDNQEIPEPSGELRDAYMARIYQLSTREAHINTGRLNVNNLLSKAAILIIVFLSGWFANMFLNQEDHKSLIKLQNQLDQNNKLLILSLIQQSSPSDRLQAINTTYQLGSIDNQVVRALINGLMYDDDPNVRMKCAEALSIQLQEDSLNVIFSKALQYQADPYIQLKLINYLGKNINNESLQIIRKFLNSGKTDEFVRTEITRTLKL